MYSTIYSVTIVICNKKNRINYIYYTYIQGVFKNHGFTFLQISQLISNVAKRSGYSQNWHGKNIYIIYD